MMKPMILTFTAAALLLLCGCSDNGFDESGGKGEMPSGGGNPQPVGMEVLGASAGELQPLTRATYNTINSGSIGVFLNPKNTGEYDVKKNVKYTASQASGATVWSSPDPLFFTAYMAYVCAYHPYVSASSYEDCTRFALSTQAYNAAYDLSYAKQIPMNATLGTATGTESGAGNKVNFTMERAYALVELNFMRGNIKDNATISRIEIITTSGLYSACNLNISANTYSSFSTAPDNKFILDKEISLPKNTSTTPVTQQILMVPTLSTATVQGLKLKLTLKSTGSPTVSTSVSGITKFEKGKKYILNMTVNATSVDLSDIKVQTGWDDEAMANSDGSTTLRPQ